MSFSMGYAEVTHCLLAETTEGLLLVDSGLGLRDYRQPTWRIRLLTTMEKVPCDPEETAFRQVERLGYSPRDVRHIVLTHLHLDHGGGIADFPWAKIHVWEREREASLHPRRFSFLDWVGYEPAQWAYHPDWVLHGPEQESWFDIPCMPVLGNSNKEALLIPLPGHSLGHCGVALPEASGWLLHCGDTFVRTIQADSVEPKNPFLRWINRIERWAFPTGSRDVVRRILRDHPGEVHAFCSHDPIAFAAWSENPRVK